MSHNTLTRASLAAWAAPTAAVTASEFWHVNVGQFKSINGDDGGVWAPTSVIEVGGDGLLVSGPFTASGTSTFEGLLVAEGGIVVESGSLFVASDGGSNFFICDADTEFEQDVIMGSSAVDDFTVEATSEFNAPTTFNEDVTFFDPTIFNDTTVFNDPVTINDTLHVTGDVDCDGDLIVGDDLVVGDALNVIDSLHVGGVSALDDDVTMGGALDVEGFIHGLNGLLIDGNVTLGNSESDTFIVEATAELRGPTTFTDHVQMGNDAGDEITLRGTATLETAMEFASAGRVPLQPITLPNDNSSFTVQEGNLLWIPTASAPRTHGLIGTQVDGDHFFVVKAATTGDITITLPGSPGSMTLPESSTMGFAFRQGSTWIWCRWDVQPG